MYDKVLAFHRAFELSIADKRMYSFNEHPMTLWELRLNLIEEEVEELRQAAKAGSVIEVADALGDMLYIAHGNCVALGLDRIDDLRPSPFAVGDVFPHPALLAGEVAALLSNVAMLRVCYRAGRTWEFHFQHRDLIFRIGDAAYTLGIALEPVFNEIHRSNMAKLVDGKVIRRDDGKVLKPDGWRKPNLKRVLTEAREAYLDAA